MPQTWRIDLALTSSPFCFVRLDASELKSLHVSLWPCGLWILASLACCYPYLALKGFISLWESLTLRCLKQCAFSKVLRVGQLTEQFIILLLIILWFLYVCVYVHRIPQTVLQNGDEVIYQILNSPPTHQHKTFFACPCDFLTSLFYVFSKVSFCPSWNWLFSSGLLSPKLGWCSQEVFIFILLFQSAFLHPPT